MSSAAEEVVESGDVCCANCGVAEVDDIKFKDCDGCDLVKYCGDGCQENHREQHSEECKKRAKELHDNNLFNPPERSHLGDCPLCFLPMPLDTTSAFWACCSTSSCGGCTYTNHKINGSLNCPFCREPAPDKATRRKMMMKRIKAGDPAAMREIGAICEEEGDYDKAFEYFRKAAKLGDVSAHFHLGIMYRQGRGVEKDEESSNYHDEKAAIGGHPQARCNLGCTEEINGNIEREQ